jgi:hypothetical protein
VHDFSFTPFGASKIDGRSLESSSLARGPLAELGLLLRELRAPCDWALLLLGLRHSGKEQARASDKRRERFHERHALQAEHTADA